MIDKFHVHGTTNTAPNIHQVHIVARKALKLLTGSRLGVTDRMKGMDRHTDRWVNAQMAPTTAPIGQRGLGVRRIIFYKKMHILSQKKCGMEPWPHLVLTYLPKWSPSVQHSPKSNDNNILKMFQNLIFTIQLTMFNKVSVQI